jgi:sugar phosphate isomerase/epimerase
MFKNLSASALSIVGHQSEILELALSYGFRGVDLPIEEYVLAVQTQGVPYARRLIDSARIRLGAFRLPLALDVADDAFQSAGPHLQRCAEVAAAMGCTRCTATIAPTSEERPYHENFEFHRRRLEELCRMFEPSEVRLGVGFRATPNVRQGRRFEFIHDPEALLTLVSMVGASNLGIVLDVWDWFVATESLERVHSLSAEQVVTVDLADLPEDVALGSISEVARLLPGTTGRIDSPAVLAALAEMGYDGPVTPKPARVAQSGVRRDAVVKRAAEMLDQVWQAAGLKTEGRPAPVRI